MTQINYKELFAEINSCKGMKYYHLLVSHQTSEAIFAGNYRQLKETLEFIHNPAKSSSLFIMDKRGRVHMILTDIIRLFHNFMASALTLVDHTRTVMRDDAVNEAYRQEYQTRVNAEFVNDPLSTFVQDLRNYLLHKGIPSTGINLELGEDTRVFIDLNKMKQWNGWKSKSKEYMSKVSEELILLDIVESYTKKVQKFHEWFREWFTCLHKTELNEFHALQELWNEGINKR